MKLPTSFVLVLLAGCTTTDAPADRSRSLFDGKTLAGFKATGNPEGWGVEDGAITCLVQRGQYLYTEQQFEDFILELEYRIASEGNRASGNSGIFFRWSDLEDPVHTGIEMQVIDNEGRSMDKHAAGAIYDIQAVPADASRPAGEWNQVRIECRGASVKCYLNGTLTGDIDLDQFTEAGKNPDGTGNKFRYAYKDLPRRGHIGFQDHGDRVWYRDIRITEPASGGIW